MNKHADCATRVARAFADPHALVDSMQVAVRAALATPPAGHVKTPRATSTKRSPRRAGPGGRA